MTKIIDYLLNEIPSWFANSKGVALSSKIKLIRNLKEFPFPIAANSVQKKTVREKVFSTLKSYFDTESIEVEFLQAEDLSESELDAIAGLYFVNSSFAKNLEGKGICLSRDGSICLLVNETDHIVIQIFKENLSFQDLYLEVNKIDDFLLKNLNIAFSEELGFLTACPTNVGTALRVSSLLHIPAIVATGEINDIAKYLSRKDIILRGLLRREESYGDIFRLSNTTTLGKTEEEIIGDLYNISTQIIKREEELRGKLISSSLEDIQDRINKSIGIINYANFLSLEEAYEVVSLFRMAKLGGLLENLNLVGLNKALLKISTKLIKAANPEIGNVQEENKMRAELLKRILNEKD